MTSKDLGYSSEIISTNNEYQVIEFYYNMNRGRF